ncbi:MAG: squalene synthase HpnC [Betaproteobacteria bacterium]|nr:squalene synthase HpnC [Betaproteobacteria bacterium]
MPVDHYENFPVASWLLPPHLRTPVAAIYWFARSADDIADEGDLPAAERLQQLDRYRAELAGIAAGAATQDVIFQRLGGAAAAYDLPLPLLSDLLDAFTQDVQKTRYADFAELLEYCRRSANPVGRLLLRLYRAESPQQLAWSDAICSSLQLINHWQDIGIDYAKGRIYLPQEDLARFNVSEAQIASATVDANWRALLRYQVERARRMMHAGAPLGRSLPGRIGLELRLIMAGGLRILEKIEGVDYDVFHRRPVLKPLDWPLLMWRALIV